MGHSRLVVAGVAAFIIILAGAMIAFLPLSSTNPPVRLILTNSVQSSQYATGSAQGLVLGLTINSSVIGQGQSISLTIVERNTLESRNDITSSGGWAFEGLSVGPCGS